MNQINSASATCSLCRIRLGNFGNNVHLNKIRSTCDMAIEQSNSLYYEQKHLNDNSLYPACSNLKKFLIIYLRFWGCIHNALISNSNVKYPRVNGLEFLSAEEVILCMNWYHQTKVQYWLSISVFSRIELNFPQVSRFSSRQEGVSAAR